jgi:hypothetical protein
MFFKNAFQKLNKIDINLTFKHSTNGVIEDHDV